MNLVPSRHEQTHDDDTPGTNQTRPSSGERLDYNASIDRLATLHSNNDITKPHMSEIMDEIMDIIENPSNMDYDDHSDFPPLESLAGFAPDIAIPQISASPTWLDQPKEAYLYSEEFATLSLVFIMILLVFVVLLKKREDNKLRYTIGQY